jgi:hypothetical protein
VFHAQPFFWKSSSIFWERKERLAMVFDQRKVKNYKGKRLQQNALRLRKL